ncbi:hypothetical protein EV361DRAFT_908915 [Lentinula raphanica]|uniref:F-box domain-containing protein n=1 Tax=Lentinula raphanica TaxID=153919 RepID=A0AA38PJT2_9AGAR|nr:hypothetical protein C8R42DRAFT_353546 [Lentinula raphanica]KAJ3759633.1 hypothetical protein EV360DRAFT_81925 [Lentinula raphanica]KAJ3844253.1 hypothetical protein F5878DRAFT_602506 [Lentinula raphanica]KAJ3971841.1 hypothetical protein EV361DRAFT_908915 [Lentinula raphanica]
MSASSSSDVTDSLGFYSSQHDIQEVFRQGKPLECKPVITIPETRSRRRARLQLLRFSSPVYRLPSEILSLIFTEYCLMSLIGPDKKMFPHTVITQVCSTWRQVAHGTPRLWSRFQASYGPDGFEVTSETMSTWLSRSGALPLDVAFRPKDASFSPAPNLFESLGSFAHRIRTLYMVIPLHTLLPLTSGFPSLTALNIRLIRDDPTKSRMRAKDKTLLPSFLRNSPRLTDLTFVGSDLSEEMIPKVLGLLVPTSPLKILQLIVAAEACHILMDPLVYLRILSGSCNSLVHCTLRCPQWMSGIAVPDMAFPHLQTLDLLDWHDECESRFLNAITVPSLRYFRTNHTYHGGFVNESFASDLIGLQTRSSAQLKTFELLGMHELPIDDIFSILAVFPTIQALGLNHCELEIPRLMQGLAYREDEPLLVPELRNFSFKNLLLKPKGSDRHIADMVESRNLITNDDEHNRPSNLNRIVKLTVTFEKHSLSQAVTKRLKNCGITELVLDEKKKKKGI